MDELVPYFCSENKTCSDSRERIYQEALGEGEGEIEYVLELWELACCILRMLVLEGRFGI